MPKIIAGSLAVLIIALFIVSQFGKSHSGLIILKDTTSNHQHIWGPGNGEDDTLWTCPMADSIHSGPTGYFMLDIKNGDINYDTSYHLVVRDSSGVWQMIRPGIEVKRKAKATSHSSEVTEEEENAAYVAKLELMRPIDSATIVILEDSIKDLQAKLELAEDSILELQLRVFLLCHHKTLDSLTISTRKYPIFEQLPSFDTIVGPLPNYLKDSADYDITPISGRSDSSDFRQDPKVLPVRPDSRAGDSLPYKTPGSAQSNEHNRSGCRGTVQNDPYGLRNIIGRCFTADGLRRL